MNKITWNDIYDEFRKKFPKRSKAAVRYAPYGYMSIMVYFSDGSMAGRGRLVAG